MKRSSMLALPLALFGVAVLAPPAATAEGFLDLYLGAGFPENDTLDFTSDIAGLGIPARRRADFETTPSLGLRGGYWFEEEANFVGVGLDLSYYRAIEDRSIAPFEFYVLPLTPLLMLRLPIESSEDFPGGRVQPYGAIGPSLNTTLAYGDLSELGTRLEDYADVSFDIGLDTRAGLAIHIAKPIAIFVEYRFTYLEPEFEDEVEVRRAFRPDAEIDVDAELATHHLAFGVSFRF